MISRDGNDRPSLCQLFDGGKKRFLRFGGRKESVEYVPRDEDEIDVLAVADPGEFVKRRPLLGQTLSVHQPFADVPVGCVKDLHKKYILRAQAKRHCFSAADMIY